jgi:proton-translocating NADH-quinone oxidoreductase chain N
MEITLIYTFLPEFFLATALLNQLIFNAYLQTKSEAPFRILGKEVLSQTAFILFCALLLVLNTKLEGFFINSLFIITSGTLIIKNLTLLLSLGLLVPVYQNFKLQKINFFEYFTLYLLAILASLLLACTADMLLAYLVLELQALSFYVLANMRRESAYSVEAGLKYFISGSVISSIFLVGCSMLYSFLGTLSFLNLELLLSLDLQNSIQSEAYNFLLVGILLITITFLFKLAVFPFHFWAPDVYDGAPLSSTIIFSIMPKASLLFFFMHWLSLLQEILVVFELLFISGILSIAVGAFYSLGQKRVKRFIIFSSISQTGYLIVGLSIFSQYALTSLFYFLFIYFITALLLWNLVTVFYTFSQKVSAIKQQAQGSLFLSNLIGFSSSNFMLSITFALVLFSFAGIPPLSGFFAKYYLIFSIVKDGSVYYGAILIILSAISTFYYLRVLKIMFFEPEVVDDSSKLFETTAFYISGSLVTGYLNALLAFMLLFFSFFPTIPQLLSSLVALSV